jgi:hypothetical protein
MTKSIAALFLVLVLAGPAPADQTQRYIFNGESLRPLAPNRQPPPTCDRWEIWFYKSVAAFKPPFPLPGEPGYWATIWRKSPQDLENQVERIQKYQRAYEKFAGLTKHDDSWDHSLGPICIEPSRVQPSRVVLQGLEVASGLETKLTQFWNSLGPAFVNRQPLRTGQTQQYRDAMDKISKAFERNSKLHNLLTRKHPPSLLEMNNTMHEATQAVEQAQASVANIHDVLVDSNKNRQ